MLACTVTSPEMVTALALAGRLDFNPLTDSLTDDPDTDTYVEMMRHNAGLIAEQLVP